MILTIKMWYDIHDMLQARDLCAMQAARNAVLSESFDPAKYVQIFNMNSMEIQIYI